MLTRAALRAAVALILLPAAAHAGALPSAPADWPVTGGDPGGMRYSLLAEIDRSNVSRLRVAWTYRHGDVRQAWGPDRYHRSAAFEGTPIVVDGRLILSTPYNRVIALDPETGVELWAFDPRIDTGRRFANGLVSRGVAYWRDDRATGPCATRVFLGTLDARLIALDARTGRPCAGFGAAGTVDLLRGIEPLVDPWEFNVTSPPTMVGDRVIVGAQITDMVRRIQPPGPVRAYDARTGAPAWRFAAIDRLDRVELFKYSLEYASTATDPQGAEGPVRPVRPDRQGSGQLEPARPARNPGPGRENG